MAHQQTDHPAWSAETLFAGPGDTLARHRAHDWSATPLGPVESWSVELRSAIRTLLPSRVPMLLWWGPTQVQLFNEAYTQVLGDKYPEAVGQPGAECWAEVWDELGPLVDAVMAGREATYSENHLLFLHRHGYREETYWTYSYSPVHDERGAVVGIFVATADVTARVLGERRLETLRQLGTLSVTRADSAHACRAAVDVLAGSPRDLPFVEVHLDGPGPVASCGEPDVPDRAVVRRVAETQRPERAGRAVVFPLIGAGRTLGVVVLGLSPSRVFDHAYATFVELVAARVATVLGDAVAYEAERDRSQALVDLNAAKIRFFQNVSHEFRTPLTLLLAPLRSLLDEHGDSLPAGQREAMAAAHRAAQRLRLLVDALLDVARAEADQLHARQEPTDVAALTVECASMFRSAADRAGLELVVDVDPTGVAVVDQEMWARIVLNLLSNALKFTSSGSVAVALRESGSDLVLSVSDTGVGVPAAEQERIFERFHQVEGITGRNREGTGIGLSLVADLAVALGGTTSLASEPGVGSTFTVTVPRRPAGPDAAPVRVAVAELGGAFVGDARQWEPPPSATGSDDVGSRVLLVEDNADLRDYLVRLLVGQHWSVEAVGDAEAALRQARDKRPHLVLSDVMLPGRDGLALLRDLRADPDLARVPVVLLTARAGSESTVEGLRHGADDYVVKPFDPVELIARVRVHLELAQVREALIVAGEHQVSTLRKALDTRDTISRAVGITMALHGCDATAAFERLAATSKNTNVKVRDLAVDLVERFTAGLP
ncbi:response regulator [Umezawaea sp. NPDC059074]|uniref:response regulator n=1 Tax=Umezawaea sp. NPDC059074 TaxID=3346716 RepID=UPI0036A55B13